MSPREQESWERLAALREGLGAPGVWICQGCSYVSLYETPRRNHERQTTHTMHEEEDTESD